MLTGLVLLLPAVGAALRLLGFKRTRSLLEGLAPLPPDPDQMDTALTNDTAFRIAQLVGIAAHHGPYRATCLRQSLALWWLLRRRGIPAELRIGVHKDEGELQAHAWVDYKDKPVNDRQGMTTRYAAFGIAFKPRPLSRS